MNYIPSDDHIDISSQPNPHLSLPYSNEGVVISSCQAIDILINQAPGIKPISRPSTYGYELTTTNVQFYSISLHFYLLYVKHVYNVLCSVCIIMYIVYVCMYVCMYA